MGERVTCFVCSSCSCIYWLRVLLIPPPLLAVAQPPSQQVGCVTPACICIYIKSDNCIIRTFTMDQRSLAEEDVNIVNWWSSKVRDILQNAGWRDIWLYPESVNTNVCVPLLRQRLRDMYICTWQENVKYYSSLSLFRQFKLTFERFSYLDILTFPNYRNILSKLRLTSHKLRIETGRHENIERNQRVCTWCNLNDLEDEFYFVLVCPFYETLRKQLIPRYYA